MRVEDIDPYLILEHMTLEEVLAIINAHENVRAMTVDTVPSFDTTRAAVTSRTVPAVPALVRKVA